MKTFTVIVDRASPYVVDAIDSHAAFEHATKRHPHAERIEVKPLRRFVKGGRWIKSAPTPGRA